MFWANRKEDRDVPRERVPLYTSIIPTISCTVQVLSSCHLDFKNFFGTFDRYLTVQLICSSCVCKTVGPYLLY